MDLDKLLKLYKKYNPKSKPNGDSQMCLLWSTNNPPDVLEGTDQMVDIEEIFDVSITEDEAIEMYDMSLSEALKYIKQLNLAV